MPANAVYFPDGMLEACDSALKGSSEFNPKQPSIVELAPGLRVLGHPVRTDFESAIYEPVLCIVLRGRKETTLGTDTYDVKTGDCLLVSHDLPVTSRIVEAPYMALLLNVSIETLRGLYEVGADLFESNDSNSLEVHESPSVLIDALWRYVSASQVQRDSKVLGPLILKEIHYRLLTTTFGGMLRSLIRYESSASVVAKAIGYIRQRFREPIVVADLADEIGVSVSAFHRQFKSVTKSSPIQYQKELRLLEARRLLRGGSSSVSRIAIEVGYESPNQFSREYGRKFGRSPKADLAMMQSAWQ